MASDSSPSQRPPESSERSATLAVEFQHLFGTLGKGIADLVQSVEMLAGLALSLRERVEKLEERDQPVRAIKNHETRISRLEERLIVSENKRKR